MFSAALKHVMTSSTGASDSLLASNVLLLKTIGTNNATNASFVDSSSNGFTVTRSGDVTQGAFSPYVPTGYWSGYFDGSGDCIELPYGDSSYGYGSGDFTVEMWYCPTASSYANNALMSFGTSANYGLWFYYNTLYFTSGDAVNRVSYSGGTTVGKWYHVAVVRSGTTITLYLDGTAVATNTGFTYNSSESYLSIGGFYNGGGSFTGYISNFRYVKSAVYTANFVPSTQPLTAIANTKCLTLQDNRIKDNSSNNYAIKKTGDVSVRRFAPYGLSWDGSLGGSGYFDGSGDYLSVTNNDQTSFATGDFTIECWFNTSAGGRVAGGGGSICGKYAYNSGGDWGFELGVLTARDIVLYNGNSIVFASPTNSFAAGVWNHLALVRQSGTMTAYVNGTSVHSATVTADLSSTASGVFWIGYAGGGSSLFNGSLSNLRIVKGSAVYTANFTPPTSPVTAISGTSLLLNFDNAAVYDATRASNLTLNGTTQTSTAQKNYADTSVVLSTSSGNRGLQTVDRPELRFGAGDFTAELWWRPSNLSGYQTIINKGYVSTGGFVLQTDLNTGRINVIVNGAVVITAPANRAVTDNAWNHIALVRSAGTVTLWVNGLSAGSASNSTNLSSTADLQIGWESQVGNAYPASGNMEDVRFSRTARYTAAFTPPTRALPVTAG